MSYLRPLLDVVFKAIFILCDENIKEFNKRKIINFFDIHFGIIWSGRLKNLLVSRKIDPINVPKKEPIMIFTVVKQKSSNKRRSANADDTFVENLEFDEF